MMVIYDSFSVDFVLKDPSERDKEKAPCKTPARAELDVVPKPWAKSFEINYFNLSKDLFVANSTLRQVLNLWYKTYSPVRLINSRALLLHNEVLELTVYQSAISKDMDAVKNLLLKRSIYL